MKFRFTEVVLRVIYSIKSIIAAKFLSKILFYKDNLYEAKYVLSQLNKYLYCSVANISNHMSKSCKLCNNFVIQANGFCVDFCLEKWRVTLWLMLNQNRAYFTF